MSSDSESEAQTIYFSPHFFIKHDGLLQTPDKAALITAGVTGVRCELFGEECLVPWHMVRYVGTRKP